jgi:MarR family transcriptional regulator, organic hydroperoxide resistance regulator
METPTAGTLRDEIKQTRPFRSPSQEAVIAIFRTADQVRHHLTAAIEPSGVTLQQYNVLRILRGAHPEPLPTLEIGERLLERTPGMTRLLDRLEEKGLVRRERCAEDRRQVHCWITPAGLQLLEAIDEPVNDADDAVVRHLSEREIRTLLYLLQRVRLGTQR